MSKYPYNNNTFNKIKSYSRYPQYHHFVNNKYYYTKYNNNPNNYNYFNKLSRFRWIRFLYLRQVYNLYLDIPYIIQHPLEFNKKVDEYTNILYTEYSIISSQYNQPKKQMHELRYIISQDLKYEIEFYKRHGNDISNKYFEEYLKEIRNEMSYNIRDSSLL